MLHFNNFIIAKFIKLNYKKIKILLFRKLFYHIGEEFYIQHNSHSIMKYISKSKRIFFFLIHI